MIFYKIIIFSFVFYLTANCEDWSPDTFPDKWNDYAKDKLDKILNRKLNKNLAKNIILFLGDGMGISTITAGRIRKGQIKNLNGEEEITNMENLSHLALSKTYCVDAQTPDSAATATAFLTGVKTRMGSIGVDGRAYDCPTSLKYKRESILKWAHYSGKSTGIITTTRITHATPAAGYASIHDRDMESYDGINFKKEDEAQGCKDIARQLVEDNNFINLIFAGGRVKFMRKTDRDYLLTNKTGDRIDNLNLIDKWIEIMNSKNLKNKFLWNMTDFKELKPNTYDRILGLMNYNHMEFETDRTSNSEIKEPSLSEMTEKAIELLSTNPNGYFLLIEGGKIDHAHHDSNARRALDDFVAFDDSIGKALNITSQNDTLIIVTADHSHVFSLGGYSIRGNPILGINLSEKSNVSDSNLTYTSLLYANGPGGLKQIRKFNLSSQDTENINYKQESAVYLKSETHGGEDVSIYANGPMSFLFDGTVEQNYIAHVMAYSACIGPYNQTFYPDCKNSRDSNINSDSSKLISFFNYQTLIFLIFLQNIYKSLY